MTAGDRGCVVIGSGPSLKAIDIASLAGVDTVAFNQSYVAWDDWGFAPTYYCAFDPNGVEDHAADLRAALARFTSTRAFLNDIAGTIGFESSPRIRFVRVLGEPEFRVSVDEVGDFGNVGASSLQVIAALGYRRVALVGIDGRYTPGNAVEELQRNYFSPAYVTPGRWYSPDPATSLQQWDRAAAGCRRAGLEVRNASPGTALECFPKTDLAGALNWVRGDQPVRA